jgi:hypothetical protein
MDIRRFCSLVRERSLQNQDAFTMLMAAGLHAPALGLLRQELDSMIRVIFLLGLLGPQRDRLIRASLSGAHWTGPSEKDPKKQVRITDRKMADYALKHHGWVDQVYRYGCNLIHLSDWHNYKEHDPTLNMAAEERRDVAVELGRFHGREFTALTFSDLLQHAPYAMDKIASNLECYVKDLEKHSKSQADRHPPKASCSPAAR